MNIWHCSRCGYENGLNDNFCFNCTEIKIAIVDLNTKPSNPKDMIGSNKIPFHLFPATAIAVGSLAFLEGAVKYGRSNWRDAGVRSSIYYDAAIRHLNAWFEGEDNTSDHGLHHLGNALACIAIIIDAQSCGKLVDDRMYPGGYTELIKKLTPEVERIKKMYEDKTPHHFSKLDLKDG